MKFLPLQGKRILDVSQIFSPKFSQKLLTVAIG
jgi:hypothetical protein